MIEFKGLGKKYREVEALREVSFEVRRGEIVGYVGPNGAGKTTTLRALTGLVSEYSGTILLDGDDIEKKRSVLHRSIGYLPQDAGFQEWRTTARMLETFGVLSGLAGDPLKRRVRAVMEMLGIAEYGGRRISQLSGGTKQKLLFAQAILHDPEILVLDEPLSGLDPASRFRLKETVRVASRSGCAVLFSSHVLADVEDLADRIAILNHGSIAAFGTPADLRATYGSENVVEVSMRERSVASVLDLGLLRGRPEAKTLSPTRVQLSYGSEADASEGMKQLLTLLAGVDHDVRSVRRLEPSLEEIYIRLTEKER